MSWALADWLTLAGIVVAIIVPAILFLLGRVNAKIDMLSAQLSSMGYDLSGRVGRLEGIEQARDDDRTAAS